jgi:hypothetical protein
MCWQRMTRLRQDFGTKSGRISAAMIDLEDIEKALVALWKGKTGATVQAIKRQPVLTALAYIVDRARSDFGTEFPSDDEIALACKTCISEACEHWTERPDSPDMARLLLGVSPGSSGTTRKVRRERIRDIYGVLEEWLTHKRQSAHDPLPSSPETPETRAIETVATTMFESERNYSTKTEREGQYGTLVNLDFVSPLIDNGFRCVSYSIEIIDPPNDWQVTVYRAVKLVSLRDNNRIICLRDGWEAGEGGAWLACNGNEEMLSSMLTVHAHGLPVHMVDTRDVLSRGEPIDLLIMGRYTKDFREPNRPPLPNTLGLFVPPEGGSISVSLFAALPKKISQVRAQTVRHPAQQTIRECHIEPVAVDRRALSGTGIARMGFLEEINPSAIRLFKVDAKDAAPGMSYLLVWDK